MISEFELISGEELHRRVIQDMVLNASRTVWIATANLKDMHIQTALGYRPVLEQFDQLARKNVSFRIVHSDIPSTYFRNTLDKYPRLIRGKLELQICPRSHWKMVVVDGKRGYMGSANFTGAGLGVKRPARRNLEVGMVSRNQQFVARLASLFDHFWIGDDCAMCAFQQSCPDPIR
jgi:phosphatidylserine/phosphatidylglycerophosphate/cardiolipin synthase-like enzyme